MAYADFLKANLARSLRLAEAFGLSKKPSVTVDAGYFVKTCTG